jgi:hypothetical protein
MIEPRRTTPLTREELYVFDTTGLLRIPGFLHPGDLPRCREEVFACDSRLMAGRRDKRRYDDLAGQSEELYGLVLQPDFVILRRGGLGRGAATA